MATLHDLLPPAWDWKASFDTANTPHLVTLLRRTGLGFVPRPWDKLGTDEEEEIEDLDVGPIRASMLDLDIYPRTAT